MLRFYFEILKRTKCKIKKRQIKLCFGKRITLILNDGTKSSHRSNVLFENK